MAKIIKIMVMLLVPLGFMATIEITAQAKTQSTPKSIRGTWVNGIQYNEHTGKFKTCFFAQIGKRSMDITMWQSDDYTEKIVAIKKLKNSYRLRLQDFSYVPLKHHKYHYMYVMPFTVNKRRCLSIAFPYSNLGKLNTIYGTVKDNGLSKYF